MNLKLDLLLGALFKYLLKVNIEVRFAHNWNDGMMERWNIGRAQGRENRNNRKMADYSGKKHIISALMRRYTDRIPVTVLIGPYCSRLTNYSVKEILQDAKKSSEAHLAFYDRFAPDSVIIYNDIY